MRSLVLKLNSMLMMVILFAVTSGFTSISHVCFMSGEHKVSTRPVSSCCERELPSSDYKISSKCCDDDLQFIKFDFTTVVQNNQQQIGIPVIGELAPLAVLSFSDFIQPEIICKNLPPPKSARSILAEISVFRI